MAKRLHHRTSKASRSTAEERAFLRDADPWGFILFKRNVDTPEQVRAPGGGAARGGRAHDAPVLIDQEGGRVQRLGAAALAELSARRASTARSTTATAPRGLRPRGSARG